MSAVWTRGDYLDVAPDRGMAALELDWHDTVASDTTVRSLIVGQYAAAQWPDGRRPYGYRELCILALDGASRFLSGHGVESGADQ